MLITILDDFEGIFADIASLGLNYKGDKNIQVKVFNRRLLGDELIRAIEHSSILVLMRDRTPLDEELISKLKSIELVIFTGTRNQALDYEALKRRGIPVGCTEFGPSKDATAELTWAMILASAKQIVGQSSLIQGGQWRNELSILPLLKGDRLGLIGLGEIGARVAKIGLAFGMEVVTWSPNMTQERASEKGVKAVALNELLSTSKVVSLHLVPSELTKGLLNAETLSMMRVDSILVNPSRASLINASDLISALKSGKPGQAAIDVYDEEPVAKNSELLKLPNLLMLPHLGFVAKPVFENFKNGVVSSINAWINSNKVLRPYAP